MRDIGATEDAPEGLFFPDTYFFASGSTDTALLKRAYRVMHERLDAAWASRASGLPLANPYEALTLASIVEKETGRAADRPLVAAVFINRLKIGMRLQTDPAVIYGIGERFDGSLKKSDLERTTRSIPTSAAVCRRRRSRCPDRRRSTRSCIRRRRPISTSSRAAMARVNSRAISPITIAPWQNIQRGGR